MNEVGLLQKLIANNGSMGKALGKAASLHLLGDAQDEVKGLKLT